MRPRPHTPTSRPAADLAAAIRRALAEERDPRLRRWLRSLLNGRSRKRKMLHADGEKRS